MIHARPIALWIVLVALCGTSALALCQSQSDAAATLKVKVNLVLVPANISTTNGRPIGNLQQKDFHILENGVEQEISLFAPVDAPVDVALVMDVSGSTYSHLDTLKEAAKWFVERFDEADRFALYTVDSSVLRVHEFSHDRRSIKRAIGKLTTWQKPEALSLMPGFKILQTGPIDLPPTPLQGGTLLYDGLALVHKEFSEEARRRVILVFTDTFDSGSKTSFDSLKYLTLRGSATLFAVLPKRAKNDNIRQLQSWQSTHVFMTPVKPKDGDGNSKKAKDEKLESSASKEWMVVLDLSAVEHPETIEKFQAFARDFLAELGPRARVWLFDYRERLRPLVFPAAGAVPVEIRALTPGEAAQLLPLSSDADSFPNVPKSASRRLQVDKILILTDLRDSGVERLRSSLQSDPLSLGIVRPEEISNAEERKELIKLLIHNPAGPLLVRSMIVNPDAIEERFRRLARDTGGDSFAISDSSEIKDAYVKIAAQIRSSYTLGYYTRAVGHHLLEVKVQDPKAVVHSRRAVIVQ